MKISIDDSFSAVPTNIKHKIAFCQTANPTDRPRSQDEEELITLDDQEVENVNELTFLDSKEWLFKNCIKTVTRK